MSYHILLITNTFRSLSRSFVRVAAREYRLPNYISGNTQRYDECSELSVLSQNVSLCTVKIIYNSVVKNKENCTYCYM